MGMIRCLPVMFVCAAIYGQEPQPPKAPTTYQVEYTIHDGSDAAAKGGRKYTLVVDDQGGRVAVRSGAKVPYTVSTGGGNTQWNYADIGVNIDSRMQDRGGKLILYTTFDMSAVGDRPRDTGIMTVNQLRADSISVMTPSKPATIINVNDPQTQKSVRVDVLVSAMK